MVLKTIYSDKYFLGEPGSRDARRRANMKSATGALYIDTLARLVPPEGTHLFELGCGQGEVLREARNRGFRVSAVEISIHAAAAANRLLGMPAVTIGTIEKVPLPANRFGAVLAADVIEHVRDPESCLRRIYELLAPGGALLLITPSLDSWTRRILGHRWMEYKIEHLYYFSPQALRRLLDRCGFEDVRIVPSRKVLTLDYLARHFDRFRVPVLTPLLLFLRRWLPGSIAHRHLLLPAGGLMATARKAVPTS